MRVIVEKILQFITFWWWWWLLSSLWRLLGSFHKNAGFLRSLEKYEKSLSFSSLEKFFFWSVSMETEKNFPDLHFWHAFP